MCVKINGNLIMHNYFTSNINYYLIAFVRIKYLSKDIVSK